MIADTKNFKVSPLPDWYKLGSPYEIYEELCTALRKILGEKDANRIIAEVEPKANVYDLITVILQMHTVIDVSRHPKAVFMLLDIIKNHMEGIAMDLIRASHFWNF